MTIVSFLLFPSGKFKSDFTTLCTSKCSLLQESFIIGTFSAFEKNSCCVGINSTSSGKSPS